MSASTSPIPSLATFGELLRYLRRRARLTQRELSIAVGYSEGHISRLEQNQRLPDLAALLALFVPALDLEDEPELIARLLEMAAAARDEEDSASNTFSQITQQEISEEFRDLKTAVRGNLPLQLTSFIGREQEIGEVRRLLGTARLLTLTGSGGCGKTRLALEVAAQLATIYPDGVWLVELASLADSALVPQTVATVLNVQGVPGRALIPVLGDHLRGKELLLVLDNCEHMVAAAAVLVESLLSTCPNLLVMATSREKLGIPGEVTFAVPPLALPWRDHPPHLAILAGYEGIRLFVERAQSIVPSFALTEENAPAVVQVCLRLDGIPLAIELAAARIQLLQVGQILARLEDVFRLLSTGSRTAPSRQQTLRATIDWSYDLLPEAERAVLRRLSVFAGGWTLEAAEAVISDPWPANSDKSQLDTEYWILNTLSSLVNKSLVLVDRPLGEPTRYRLLAMIRQYAHEQLLAAGEEEEVHVRHLAFFLRLAEEAGPELFGSKRLSWLERLELEHDNLRGALRCCPSAEHGKLTARLASALFWFWQSRGYLGEGRAHLGRILREMPAVVSSHSPDEAAVWATALWAAGSLAWIQGDNPAGRAQLERSVQIWRGIGAAGKRGLAIALRELAIVSVYQGDLTGAGSFAEEGVRLCGQAASRWDLALALYNQGLVYELQGEGALARSNFAASLSLFRELNEAWGIAVALFGLGRLAGRQGDCATALALLEECLALQRAVKDPLSMGETLYLLGEVAQRLPDTQRATRFYAECLALAQEVGDTMRIGFALHNLGKLAQLDAQLERAARLFVAARPLRDPLATTMSWSLTTQADCEQDIASIHTVLGDEAFSAAQSEGAAMTMAQAIAYALATSERFLKD